MKKIAYSDEWGSIVEYTRYRGKGGRYISDKWGKRAEKLEKYWVKKETEQWRVSEGRRTEKISVFTPDRLMKTTFPGGLADHDYDIYETLRDTNVFTQVSKARQALINIRGLDENGKVVRLQGEIVVGDSHQDQQLAYAINAIVLEADYRISEIYSDYMPYRRTAKKDVYVYTKKQFREHELLRDISVSVTLLR